jgi:hypothetical protein
MENIWGIKISRIALPEDKLTESEWFKQLKVSTRYNNNEPIENAISLNKQYNFSKIKNRQNESTNYGA